VSHRRGNNDFSVKHPAERRYVAPISLSVVATRPDQFPVDASRAIRRPS